MTVEGVPTAKVAVEFARRCGLDLPIFNAVSLIISGELRIEVCIAVTALYCLGMFVLPGVVVITKGCALTFDGSSPRNRIQELGPQLLNKRHLPVQTFLIHNPHTHRDLRHFR